MAADPNDITQFWRAAGPPRWFAKNDVFDAEIRMKYEPAHHAAARGEHDGWLDTADGALALMLLLDQFPRNLYRGSGHAFATDGKARGLARAAIARGHDQRLEPQMRPFLYLPFEHSEDLADQDESVRLCALLRDQAGDEDTLKWARIHRDIIVRFGRFPHRNASLGRTTTPEELAFLDEGGFKG
ncbi:MAG TPA: DUF924 family protein [Phenylobacterium sp.]|nr:DUF924 family protein [Phenylobacterium sp.]